MQHQEFEVPEGLREAIKCFWYTSMDFGAEGSSFEVMPDGYAEIVFLFGNECSVSYNGTLQPLPSPFLMAMLNKPMVIHTKGVLTVVGTRCFPWAVFELLGLQGGKDGVDIYDHPIAQLQPALNNMVAAGRIDMAVDAVKQYFMNAGPQAAVDNILTKAGAAMSGANGTMQVSEVAAAAHATVRTLERKFRRSTGYTVKDVSGVMRFEQARNHLWLHPDCSLARLAQELGYTDQAHLTRAFRRYSGTTPAAFARKWRML